MTDPAAVIVLAAGQGTRMKSRLPKVLHGLCGRTMIGHVIHAAGETKPSRLLVVVGHGRDWVEAELASPSNAELGAVAVVQAEQRGTGHAVKVALEAAPELTTGSVIVLTGDAPLITAETITKLLDRHTETNAAVTILTAIVDDPMGYGRIVRDGDGHPVAIVEERDADELTKAITEIGTAIYAFDVAALRDALSRLSTDNSAGEEYLTDVVALTVADHRVVAAVTVEDPVEVMGINDRYQLSVARRAMRDQILRYWMLEGVTITDPETTWMGVNCRLEPDVTLHQNTQLHGNTLIRSGAIVGPDCTLTNTLVDVDATVVRCHAIEAEIGPGAVVGPYAYLRPGTVLKADSKIGTFVEVKNSEIGEGSKVPHLTYVGDATIGRESNIGASSVFVNYDGVEKRRSTIGDHVKTGSDNTFVAPVTIGDGAYTGAGSVIREDVPPGALAVSAGTQRNIEGWVAKKRPGTAAQKAADATQSKSSPENVAPEEQTDHNQGAVQ